MNKFDITVIKISAAIVLAGAITMVTYFAMSGGHRLARIMIPTDRLKGWSWNQTSRRTASGGVTIDQGALRCECLVSNGRNDGLVLASHDVVAQAGRKYQISFTAKASDPRDLLVSADQGRYRNSSANIGLYKTCSLSSDWKPYQFTFTAKGELGHNVGMPVFGVGGRTGVVWIKDVSVEEVM